MIRRFFSRDNTVAPSTGFNRWMVPPAALAVHLCIGQIYGFSVFNLPLTRLLGIAKSVPGDWTIPEVGWIYSIALFMLGASAALFGKWVERVGPRLTMFTSACCFTAGFLLLSLAASLHSLWLAYLGYGVIGGIGLGLGYIAPVSTLVKWFPDRPGMATGLAIMGFGGGAMIGAPLAQELMFHFKTASSVGVVPTCITMAILYFVLMNFGMLIVRVPPNDWRPAGWAPKTNQTHRLITTANVNADVAWKTPQFWLLWGVLCMNVSAGIGILGQASLMTQDMFGVSAAAAAGFAGLLSIANMAGRFLWSSFSDVIGRKNVYFIYFVLGAVLYFLIPVAQQSKNLTLFVLVATVIISMYGGGFATIPAYLKDLFGTAQVGAIHGRLITAWSIAALIGPNLINNVSDGLKKAGVPKEVSYNPIMYIMIALLGAGFVCNLFVRPVDRKYHNQPVQPSVKPESTRV